MEMCFLFGALAREGLRNQCIFFFLCPVRLKSIFERERGEGGEDERIEWPNGAGSMG